MNIRSLTIVSILSIVAGILFFQSCKDDKPKDKYLYFEQPEVFAPGETRKIPFLVMPFDGHTQNTSCAVSDVPAGWVVTIDNTAKTITITAPLASAGGEATITLTTPRNVSTSSLLLALKEGTQLYIDFEQPQAFMPGETKTIPFRILPQEVSTVTGITYVVSDLPASWAVTVNGNAKTISITAPMVSDGGTAKISLTTLGSISDRPLHLTLREGLRLQLNFEQPQSFLPEETKTIPYTLESDYPNVTVTAANIPAGWQVTIDQAGQKIQVTAPACFGNNSVTAQITASIESKTYSKTLNLQADARKTEDEGVEINGVVWATRNVDAPGTFASTPDNPGMFYQCNRRVGWSVTDPLTPSDGVSVWSGVSYYDFVWLPENDPCPCGWRVPELEEASKLIDATKVNDEQTTQNGRNGRKITDKMTEKSIFLPESGSRFQYGDLINHDGTASMYGINGHNIYSSVNNLGTRSNTGLGTSFPMGGHLIRCVKK